MPTETSQPNDQPREEVAESHPAVNLNAALARAQHNFPEIARTKNGRVGSNESGRTYKYAGIDAILKAIMPALTAEGLSLRQPIRRQEMTMLLVTELHHSSGEWIADDGLPLKSGQTPQQLGSEITYMRRYGLAAMLGVATDDDDDGHAATEGQKGDLTRAQQRTDPATRAARAQAATKPAETKPSGVATISDDQVKEWNKVRKASGYSIEEASAFIATKGWKKLQEIPVTRWKEALEWASTPKTEAKPTETKPLSEEPVERDPLKADNAQQRSFWDAARKHGKTDGEVAAFLKRELGIESTGELKVADLGKALDWATAAGKYAVEMSADEKTARDGFGILGLNITEQAELIERYKGDWAGCAEAVQMQIDSMEADSQ